MSGIYDTHEDKLTIGDDLSIEKIIKYIDDEWSELSPSFQLVIVKWLVDELSLAEGR
jgi:hypothetical protein